MEVGQPEITVVIATRDRSRRLASALESLRAQTLGADRFEVIVVDDGSTDETPAVLAAERERGELALTVLEHGTGGGPGAVRNTGLEQARGALVAFTDDDCEADPAWLQEYLAAWQREPERFLQGSTTPIEAEIGEQDSLSYTYDIHELDVNFPCCNMAYPRPLLERIGGFDAAAFPRTGEDCDLAWRAIATGAEPVFVPGARVRHAVVHMQPAGLLRRAWGWSYAVPAFARHPELRRRRLMHRLFYNWAHWYLLRVIVALALPRRRALWPLKLWLARRYFEDRRWAPGSDRPSLRALGWNLLFDSVELAGFANASVRHRTIVL